MSFADIESLNARFGIADELTFHHKPEGCTWATVCNEHAQASVALQGAQLTSWTPRGQEPVIWLSPQARFANGHSIRGGVPVCWPWFGPHDSESDFPAHGFARTSPWQILETRQRPDGSTRLSFRLVQCESAEALWPHSSPLELHLTIGSRLDIELITRNIGREPIAVGQALHTYFAVSDIRKVSVHGLDGCPYIDKVAGGERKFQAGSIRIKKETDRIYFDSGADCLIDDPGFGRRIRITKRGSQSTVVWNPWVENARRLDDLDDDDYLDMLCVESANAGDDIARIPPGEEHRLWVRYSVETAN